MPFFLGQFTLVMLNLPFVVGQCSGLVVYHSFILTIAIIAEVLCELKSSCLHYTVILTGVVTKGYFSGITAGKEHCIYIGSGQVACRHTLQAGKQLKQKA